MKLDEKELATHTTRFSVIWSLHCKGLDINNNFARGAGLAHLFEIGFEHELAVYFFDLNAQQRSDVDQVIASVSSFDTSATSDSPSGASARVW